MKAYLNIFLILSLLFYSCGNEKSVVTNYAKISGFTQGTTYNITYNDSLGRNLQSKVDSLLSIIDQSVSTYIETSQISTFNNLEDTSKWFALDEVFYKNMLMSKHIYQLTDSTFDPTVSPLYSYYKFDEEGINSLDSLVIDSLKQFVGLHWIELDQKNKSIRKRIPELTLNFNAIAQGFSVDFIAEYFQTLGIEDYMIEIGGEIRTKGRNPMDKLWMIGIDVPTENAKPGEDFQKVLEMMDESLATSGSYRKFFKIGDKRYSHTINPNTGFPVAHSLLSVSVKANTCAEADAYATAFMVLGVEKSLKLINENVIEADAYFISSKNDSLVEVNSANF